MLQRVVGFAVVAGLLAGCAGRAPAPAAPPPSVATVVAIEGSVQPALNFPGIVAPYQDVMMSTTLAEPADAVEVQEGDRVAAGQLLALLDTADLRATLESDVKTAESDAAKTTQTVYTARLSIVQGNEGVLSAQAALRQAQQTLTNDQKNLARDRQLVAQGYITQQTVDQQETTVQNDTQAVAAAQAGVVNAFEQQQVNGNGTTTGLQLANIASARADAAAAYAAADEIRTQIAKARIVAPVGGTVVNRNLNPGEYPGSRQIFTIEETDTVFAVLNATTHDVFSLPRNATASIRVSDEPRVFPGRVVAVLDQLTPGSTNFAVKVEVPNPGLVLHAGMSVTGTIALPASRGIAIPTTAFLDDTHASVLTVGADGVAHVRSLSELRSDGKTSIVSGIPAGTRVVADGQAGISDGERITVAAR